MYAVTIINVPYQSLSKPHFFIQAYLGCSTKVWSHTIILIYCISWTLPANMSDFRTWRTMFVFLLLSLWINFFLVVWTLDYACFVSPSVITCMHFTYMLWLCFIKQNAPLHAHVLVCATTRNSNWHHEAHRDWIGHNQHISSRVLKC